MDYFSDDTVGHILCNEGHKTSKSHNNFLTTARSALDADELKGSEPPSWEPNGSLSPAGFIFCPNGSESPALPPAVTNGSLAVEAGSLGWAAKGSVAAAAAAVSLDLAAKRSGSGASAVEQKGSSEPENGSCEEKGALEEEFGKKESAAKGSEPLKGSPPKGSA